MVGLELCTDNKKEEMDTEEVISMNRSAVMDRSFRKSRTLLT